MFFVSFNRSLREPVYSVFIRGVESIRAVAVFFRAGGEPPQSSAGSTVSVPASEPGGREFHPGLCSCSVFAIICNEFDTANLLQVRFMVTSELSLTCCKLTASLHTCHDKFVANLHSCHDKFVASLLQTKIAIWVPPKTQHHGQHSVFVSKDLSSCSHVFLRTDALRKGLQPPYEGPFQVLDRNEKIFKINKNGKELTVNIDRVKPAYVLRDCDSTRLPR
ncbi:hypothetical protein AVEN_13688-1 [Araneus ventricosus]|uniref:Uncharacterized protein n=1 Tax=Araneus ventricosus TaxID=182803 RepID=A0A4Y2B596_ARAVE|nr:hypothetical protein AVEN_13688-1 [Araneus ventricosus]